MSTREHRPGRSAFPVILALALGVVAGGGAVWAHLTGRLAPLYHQLGLHAAHQPAGKRQKHAFSKKLNPDLPARCPERLADADLFDAGLHIGQHRVHDAHA